MPDKTDLILYRLDEHSQDLAEIKRQVQATNGRVSGLERWRERSTGFLAALGLAVPVLTGIAVRLIAG